MKWRLGQNHTHAPEQPRTFLRAPPRGADDSTERRATLAPERSIRCQDKQQIPNPHLWLCYGLGVVHPSKASLP